MALAPVGMEEAKQAAEAFKQDIAAVTAAVESEEGPLDEILQEGGTDDALKQEQAAGAEHGPARGADAPPLGPCEDVASTVEQTVQGLEPERSDEIATGDAGETSVNSSSVLELVEGRGVGGPGEMQPAPLPPNLPEAVPPSSLERVDAIGAVEQKVQEPEPERSDEIAAGDAGNPSVNELEDGRSSGGNGGGAGPIGSIVRAGSAAEKTSSAEPPPSPRRSYSSRSSPSLRLPGRAPRTPRAPAMARTASQTPNANDTSQNSSWQPLVARPGSAHHSNWAENGSPTRALASQYPPRFGSPRTDGTTVQATTSLHQFLSQVQHVHHVRWHRPYLIDAECVPLQLTWCFGDSCTVAASPETDHHRSATGAVCGGTGGRGPVTISHQRPAILSHSNDPQLLPNGTGFGNSAAQKQAAAGGRSLHEPYGRSLSAHASSQALVAHQAQANDRLEPHFSLMPERWFVPRACETPPRALPYHMLALSAGNAGRAASGTPLQPGDTVYVADVKFVQGLPWAKVRCDHVFKSRTRCLARLDHSQKLTPR